MNSRFYKIGIGISIVLIGIIIAFFLLAKKSDDKISEGEDNFPSAVSSTNITEESTVADTNTFNEINETEKSNNNIKNEITTITESRSVNKNEEKKSENTGKNNTIDNKKESNTDESNADESKVDPVFSYPVEGEVVIDYAKDKLIYSSTLNEWITHMGIDIKADKTTVVKSSADGTVKSIKNDPRYGLTVVVEHKNNYSTVYSNLLTAEFVNVGEKITSGQTIGTVGNTASFEILDEPHLHFEILKDNEQIDPNMYLKK